MNINYAQVYDALAYYYDNKAEIDTSMKTLRISEEEIQRRALDKVKPYLDENADLALAVDVFKQFHSSAKA